MASSGAAFDLPSCFGGRIKVVEIDGVAVYRRIVETGDGDRGRDVLNQGPAEGAANGDSFDFGNGGNPLENHAPGGVDAKQVPADGKAVIRALGHKCLWSILSSLPSDARGAARAIRP